MISKIRVALEKMYSYIYWKFYKSKVREKSAKHKVYNVQELFMQQNKKNGYSRMDIIVRYLAIENYYGINGYGFELYRKMQDKRIEQGYSELALEKFIQLIKSFQEQGYDKKSEILLDKNLKLLDGSHRIACALYFGIDKLACKVYEEAIEVSYGMEWFIKNGFTLEEIDSIKSKYEELMDKCLQPISLILWPPVAPYFDEILEKVSYLCDRIENVRVIDYPEQIFERVVHAIYHVDDVSVSKIAKKIQYMKKWDKRICVADIYMEEPKFRRKGLNGNTISSRGEVIKNCIRTSYKEIIEDYFHDIIIHTADNYEQSQYINEIIEEKLSLKEYFESIYDYEWMLIKTEADYMPLDFPNNIPFSKDVDMISSNDDFINVVESTWQYLNTLLSEKYEIRKIDDKDRVKIRVEKKGFLIIQIDISRSVAGLKQSFVESSLKNRHEKNGYYVSTDRDEVYFRMNEYRQNPNKIWHKVWVENHAELFDAEYFANLKEKE